jgi:hypothetical protein
VLSGGKLSVIGHGAIRSVLLPKLRQLFVTGFHSKRLGLRQLVAPVGDDWRRPSERLMAYAMKWQPFIAGRRAVPICSKLDLLRC